MSLMKRNVLFLSAAERWNLGDLLFPIMFAWYARREGIHFVNLGLREFKSHDSDIIDVYDIRDYIHSKNSALVIGGGEVLGATTMTLLRFIEERNRIGPMWIQILSKIARASRLRILIRLVDRVTQIICQAKYGMYSIRAIPFYVGVCSKLPRIYLPVGGHFPKVETTLGDRILKESVRNTIGIAARDERTLSTFPKELKSELIPDPVSTISNVFPAIERKKRVVIQFSHHKLSFELDRLVKLLRAFSSKGYEIYGLAIGRCPGHLDIDSLELLQSKIPELVMPQAETVRASCEILSSASVYIGTSLHGAIISHAYGNAVIGIAGSVPKLSSYMRTWMGEFAMSYDGRSENEGFTSFAENFDHDSAKANSRKLAGKAEMYTELVLSKIAAMDE